MNIQFDSAYLTKTEAQAIAAFLSVLHGQAQPNIPAQPATLHEQLKASIEAIPSPPPPRTAPSSSSPLPSPPAASAAPRRRSLRTKQPSNNSLPRSEISLLPPKPHVRPLPPNRLILSGKVPPRQSTAQPRSTPISSVACSMAISRATAWKTRSRNCALSAATGSPRLLLWSPPS